MGQNYTRVLCHAEAFPFGGWGKVNSFLCNEYLLHQREIHI